MNRQLHPHQGYSDPDVVALIRAAGSLSDPRSLILTQARRLNASYRRFDTTSDTPMKRLIHLASLRGLSVAPMNLERRKSESRDAVIILNCTTGGKQGDILYNSDRPPGRIAFSIAHEISHTFFSATSGGARFREMCESDSREANELERLCDLGAAELLMPVEEFRQAVGGCWSIAKAYCLVEQFGASFEAAVFRLGSAFPGVEAAGSLRFRRTKSDEAKLAHARRSLQPDLFCRRFQHAEPLIADPKYRRQGFHCSDDFSTDDLIRWNRSFDESSVVYKAARAGGYVARRETLSNGKNLIGTLEVVRAPYQRENASSHHPDLLFFWKKD